jgi:hypothetical protein
LYSRWTTRHRVALAEVLAMLFMGLIAAAAHTTGFSLLLFPELAALAHDVFTRPRGKWASQPLRLIITPTITGVAGLLISRYTHYGALQVLLITLVSLAVIRMLRSAIGPAISAGVLPLVLGERHWAYPLAILIGLTGLSASLWIWKALTLRGEERLTGTPVNSIDDALEGRPHSRLWLVHLLSFVFVLASVGQYTGLHFILFPPLIVMAYELFGHPELPGWIRRPALFPLTCFLTAAIGFGLLRLMGNNPMSVALTVALSILVLRVFRAHMPPALAVGLLPYVMAAPNIWYPISVGVGTAFLSLWFAVRTRFQGNSRHLPVQIDQSFSDESSHRRESQPAVRIVGD